MARVVRNCIPGQSGKRHGTPLHKVPSPQAPRKQACSLTTHNCHQTVGTCCHWYPQGSNVKQRKSVLVGYPRLTPKVVICSNTARSESQQDSAQPEGWQTFACESSTQAPGSKLWRSHPQWSMQGLWIEEITQNSIRSHGFWLGWAHRILFVCVCGGGGAFALPLPESHSPLEIRFKVPLLMECRSASVACTMGLTSKN